MSTSNASPIHFLRVFIRFQDIIGKAWPTTTEGRSEHGGTQLNGGNRLSPQAINITAFTSVARLERENTKATETIE